MAGASEGIGRAFAQQLAARGMDLILLARRLEPLEALASELRAAHSVQAVAASVDLGAPELGDRLREVVGDREVGLAVYNACYSSVGEFMDTPLEAKLTTIDVNCRGPVAVLDALTPPMVARGAMGGARAQGRRRLCVCSWGDVHARLRVPRPAGAPEAGRPHGSRRGGRGGARRAGAAGAGRSRAAQSGGTDRADAAAPTRDRDPRAAGAGLRGAADQWGQLVPADRRGAGLSSPTGHLPGRLVFGLAWTIEAAQLMGAPEPPVTRIGVLKLVRSSALRIDRAGADLGYSPQVRQADGLAAHMSDYRALHDRFVGKSGEHAR